MDHGVKVVGVGWAKTGTTTLGTCLKRLGLNHCTQRLDLVPALASADLSPIKDVASQYESFEDWPWLLLFRELDEWFPSSRFVLTTRAAESWLRSYKNMLKGEGHRASAQKNETRRILYGLPFPNVSDRQLIDRYTDHERQVREYFEDRAESLLVVNWQDGDGWKQLCAFLELPVPDEPFPHSNQGTYGRTRPAFTWLHGRAQDK